MLIQIVLRFTVGANKFELGLICSQKTFLPNFFRNP